MLYESSLAIVSVLIVSVISLIGVITISVKEKTLKKIMLYFVSFAAGALFGDAFIHLLPKAVETGFSVQVSLSLLSGIVILFLVEKLIKWRHCHLPTTKKHPHPFAYMNLFGDGVHNFIDGLIIGASYIVSIPIGIATTIAVILHEIPQEIGDFGVLLHGGFTKRRALLLNFVSALIAVGGTIIALVIGSQSQNVINFLIPFAAGGFIYIAGSDLIPELHKEEKLPVSLLQLLFFIIGIAVMYLFLLIE